MAEQAQQRIRFSELEKAKALKSFKGLIEIAKQDITKAAAILTDAATCPTPYPNHYAIIYLMGMLQVSCWKKDLTCFLAIMESHKELLEEKPSDYIGEKRVWGRGGGR